MSNQSFWDKLDSIEFGCNKKHPFKVQYQIWDAILERWQHCEFYLFASDLIEAKRLAVERCQNHGRPIDYHAMDVQAVV